jgi:vancomycin resistance protein VanW
MRLSEIHPVFYHTRVQQLRLKRYLADQLQRVQFAERRAPETLPMVVKRHQSLLRRRLGSVDPQLQENKIVNLRIACAPMDGVLIRPGETFSFWHLVGNNTAAKGYLPGLEIRNGEAAVGRGGGICQLGNLLHWMVLHSPLQVVERHHHSFDPFPDDRRALPFGTGACVFYNYVDLRFFNPTAQTFQLRVEVGEVHLKGILATEVEWPYAYHIEERDHQFLKRDGRNYRQNEIWRRVVEKRTGETVRTELMMKNFAEVRYELS